MELDQQSPTTRQRIHRFLDRWDWVIFAALVAGFWFYNQGRVAPAVEEGDVAPAFALTSLEGTKHSLDDYRGRAVALTFWASWCGVCKMELPSLSELSTEVDPAKAVVVSVAVSSALDEIRAFTAEKKLNFPVLIGPQEVSDAYGVRALPTTVIIGPDGTVRETFTGYTIAGSVGRALRAAMP
ncbi:MAG: redoxin domain-containing protein [Chrysiogenetes bacterium]|nr:redoxin domain-containing protein [Chrysiogenetes bacterium]